jgi:hypothetical protein
MIPERDPPRRNSLNHNVPSDHTGAPNCRAVHTRSGCMRQKKNKIKIIKSAMKSIKYVIQAAAIYFLYILFIYTIYYSTCIIYTYLPVCTYVQPVGTSCDIKLKSSRRTVFVRAAAQQNQSKKKINTILQIRYLYDITFNIYNINTQTNVEIIFKNVYNTYK